jgi:hypothetical protein
MDHEIVIDSGYKFSLANIIDQGPNNFSGEKRNFFEQPWSRTTHLPSVTSSFVDEDRLDTPAFPRNGVDEKKLMEIVEEEMTMMQLSDSDDADFASLEGNEQRTLDELMKPTDR